MVTNLLCLSAISISSIVGSSQAPESSILYNHLQPPNTDDFIQLDVFLN